MINSETILYKYGVSLIHSFKNRRKCPKVKGKFQLCSVIINKRARASYTSSFILEGETLDYFELQAVHTKLSLI